MNNNFDTTVQSLFQGMDSFITTKTVVGDAVTIGDTIILPLVDVAFGVGALLSIYFLVPWFEKIYEKIPPCIRKTVGVILLLLFVADGAYAAANPNIGHGITY